jgi:hypothetical protein
MASARRILMLPLLVPCIAAPPASAAAAPGRGRSVVARRFARAYVRYIDGREGSSLLPAVTRSARVEAVEGGKIPRRHRHGRVVVVSLKQAKGVQGGVLIDARADSTPFFAEAVLTNRGGRWLVTDLLTPDWVQVFTHPVIHQAPAPRGATAPQASARQFLIGYLAWAYGHGPVSAIQAASSDLVATLAANPPNIPPTMTGLHGRVRAIAMRHHGIGWEALVNVNDAYSTYQLTLALTRSAKGKWQVTRVMTQ